MPRQCVVAVLDSLSDAKAAIERLESSGVSEDAISLVTKHVEEELPETKPLEYGDDTQRDIAKGAGAGGLLGVLLGAPLLAIPGVGLVLAAGPIAAGLTGAVLGGFLGAMTGWGVSKGHVGEYEEKVREGASLVVVMGDPATVAEAETLLKESPASSVDLHAETSADDVDR